MPNKRKNKDSILAIINGVLLFSFLAVITGPPIIDWLYHLPSPNEFFAVEWNATEALGYYGDTLGFISTVVLGAVAVFQTDRANQQTDRANKLAEKANEQTERANQLAQDALLQTERANELAAQMQKLEQAKFVSMVSVDRLHIYRHHINNIDYINVDMRNPVKFDMVDKDFWPFSHCYLIDVLLKNESEYPKSGCVP